MAFSRVCAASEVAEGEMAAFFLNDWEVLVVRDSRGELHAMDGICPHEEFPLVFGNFDGMVVTCANHLWCFDATTGKGIRPPSCRLEQYAVKVEGEDIYVDTEMSPQVDGT